MKSIMKRLLSTTPLLHLIILTYLFSHVQPLCHPDESTALLEFKDSFIIRRNASGDPLAYPKVASWSPKERDDCCSWDGVECDEHNSHVIALNLSSSCLYGSINSNSRLFRLSHLQTINLADNDFNGSLVPSQLSHLPSLTYLDLSDSVFAGQIPLEISQLFNLSFLDLSLNQLELKRPDFSTFVRNLSKIMYLSLSYVDISSPVPSFLANFSSLTSLYLEDCGLYGEFPIDIFQLPNLQFLHLANNNNLTGSFPEFHAGSPLRELSLSSTGFSGHVPSSIGNLNFLNKLGVLYCGFHGSLPSSLGRLSNLKFLELGGNAFSGTVDFNMFLNMKNLTILGLSGNMLSVLIRENGTTISTNATLPKFEVLLLGSCNLTTFPGFLRHQYGLKRLDLSNNSMHGKVPQWIWNTSIEILDIRDNFFTGFSIDVLPSISLRILHFSGNNFMGALPILPPSTRFVVGPYNELSGEISPQFFNLSSLQLLDLSHNKLSGVVPECLRNTNHNLSIAGVPQTCSFGSQLQVMDLSYNQFRGRLPQSLLSNCLELNVLKLENNHFIDVFPSWLGNLRELKLLALSHNKLSGVLPECLRNTNHNLSSAGIPQTCSFGRQLQVMDLSYNQFQGRLPQSLLSNCLELKVLKLENNHFRDVFPSWLGNLRELKLLLLRSNHFHGEITSNSTSEYDFPSLQIMDLSHNNLSGVLPSHYFQYWNAMKDFDGRKSSYLSTVFNVSSSTVSFYLTNLQSVTVTNKGRDMEYVRILEVFKVIDLSSNRFQGDIPECMGNLKGLRVLNLSNNMLDGSIPSSLSDITQLESLDLSLNKLSGEIPQQLVRLTFLAFFNVSFNCLSGLVPQGNQFSTFDSSSYEGNAGLRGLPGISTPTRAPPSASGSEEEDNQDSRSWFESNWMTILPGFVGGLMFGVAIEHLLAIDKRIWFIKFFDFGVVTKTKGRKGRKLRRTT